MATAKPAMTDEERRGALIKDFHVIKELYTTECAFRDDLQKGLDAYEEMIRDRLVPEDADRVINGFREAIAAANDFISILNEADIDTFVYDKEAIGKLKTMPLDKLNKKHDKLIAALASCYTSDAAFSKYTAGLSTLTYAQTEFSELLPDKDLGIPEGTEGIGLIGSYLIMPFQRRVKHRNLWEVLSKGSQELHRTEAEWKGGIEKSIFDLTASDVSGVDKKKGEDLKIMEAVEKEFKKMYQSEQGRLSSAKSSMREVLGAVSSRDKMRDDMMRQLAFAISRSEKAKDFTSTLETIKRLKEEVKQSPGYNEKNSTKMRVLKKFEEKYEVKQVEAEKIAEIRSRSAARKARISGTAQQPLRSTESGRPALGSTNTGDVKRPVRNLPSSARKPSHGPSPH